VPDSQLVRSLAGYGFWAAIVLLILTVGWIVSLALAPMPASGASTAESIQFLAENEGWHVANFAIVLPMGFVHVPVWIGLAAVIWFRRPAMAVLTVAFGLLYTPFAVLGYWTQLTTVRGIADLADDDLQAATALFELMVFDGELWSLSYGVVVMGYAIWGLAALHVCAGTFDSPDRLTRITGILFGASGLAGIAGAIGLVARNELIELGVLFSGILFFPALIGAAALLWQAHTGRRRIDTAASELRSASR
jgi:hypothetical protein